MASAYVEESVVTDKLNFSVWIKTVKYIKKLWPIVIVLLLCMFFQAFYDSSFIPVAISVAFKERSKNESM